MKKSKKEILSVAGKFNNFYHSLNIFLFNCVIKGIVPYDCLTLQEKISLNRILDGLHTRIYYNPKVKIIMMNR